MSNANTITALYLMQHGLAVDKKENSKRPLSKQGIEQTEAIATQMYNAEIKISAIFHSGKLRALQTAEIIANTLGIDFISATDNLSPNDDTSLIVNSLTTDQALYVGHLPHMEKLASHLVIGDSKQKVVQFQNSAVACLIKHESNYLIRWYLTPAITNMSKQLQ